MLCRSHAALTLTHLVKVPLMLRPAAMEDLPALMLLQSNSGTVPQVCAHAAHNIKSSIAFLL